MKGHKNKSFWFIFLVDLVVIGSENMPAIPLNSILEATMIPNANKVSEAIKSMLSY